MKKLAILCALCAGLFTNIPLGRAEAMQMSHMPITGGAFGTSPATPGTNSLGTALPSSGRHRRMRGPPLGTGNAAVDREDARVDKMVRSICRGC